MYYPVHWKRIRRAVNCGSIISICSRSRPMHPNSNNSMNRPWTVLPATISSGRWTISFIRWDGVSLKAPYPRDGVSKVMWPKKVSLVGGALLQFPHEWTSFQKKYNIIPLTPIAISKQIGSSVYLLFCPFVTPLHSDITQTASSGGHLSMWENRCMHATVCLLRADYHNSCTVVCFFF